MSLVNWIHTIMEELSKAPTIIVLLFIAIILCINLILLLFILNAYAKIIVNMQYRKAMQKYEKAKKLRVMSYET